MELISKKQLANHLLEVQAWAAKGDTAACVALAHAYYHGGHGVEKNFKEAKGWLERIDEAEDPYGFAPHLLGVIHYKGLVAPADHRTAFKYFRRAALLGHAKSRITVAVMQCSGDGTLKKPHSAKLNFYRCSKDPRLSRPLRWYLALEFFLIKR